MELLSDPELARLHPTFGHPEQEARIQVVLDALDWAPGSRAELDDLLRCHDADYLERLRGLERATQLDPDTIGSETSFEAALRGAGAAIAAGPRGGLAPRPAPGDHPMRGPPKGVCLGHNVPGPGRS